MFFCFGKNYFWGILLITLGTILLLENLGFQVNILKYWPIILIIWGISVLIKQIKNG